MKTVRRTRIGFRGARTSGLALIAALAVVSTAANAAVVTFAPFGGAFPLYTLPPGETLYFDDTTGLVGTGSAALFSGPLIHPGPGESVAAPAISTSTQISTKYLGLTPGHSQNLTFSDVADVSLYIGSLDLGNELVFHATSGDITYTGGSLASDLGLTIPPGAANILSDQSNGRFTFNFGSNEVTGVTLSEAASPLNTSFEVAQIATSVIPEPATWLMMLLGFLGLGFAGYRGTRKSISLAA